MIKLFAAAAISLFLFVSAEAAIWPGQKPKLVVMIVIDQFRADYLSRFQNKFGPNGFKSLLQNGAYFPFAEYDILQCMTGPGHATVLTGAYPYQMGIPVNDWYDQKSHGAMYCVGDKTMELVGLDLDKDHSHDGVSPKNLIATTVGDELKNAGMQSKIISVALKDRAAVLMGGHRADLALWNDGESGRWISSKYYLKDGKLPQWVQSLNHSGDATHCDWAKSCGVEKTVKAFKAALENYKLGQGSATDILAVSFSSHDYAGHRFGPNSKEIEDMTLAEDKAIAEIVSTVKKSVPGGLNNTLFILTGDHGVAPKVDYSQAAGIESERINENVLADEMNAVLNKNYGKPKSGKWITYIVDFNFYVDEDSAQELKADMEKVEGDMKAVLIKNPGFAQVFTRAEYESKKLPPLMFERQILKTYYKGRSGHVIGITKPFYINETKNQATHLSGYSYDRTVPLIFSGFGIKSGTYAERAEVVDIAPTLSFILGVIPPSLSEGRVLKEILRSVK